MTLSTVKDKQASSLNCDGSSSIPLILSQPLLGLKETNVTIIRTYSD